MRQQAPGIDISKARTLRRGRDGRRNALLYYVDHQQKWIAWCNRNGESYTGENGPAIRKADRDELTRLEKELASCPRRLA